MSVLNLDFENLIRKEIKEYKINQLLEDIHLTYSEHITKIRSNIRNIYKSTFKEQYHKLFHCKDDENQFIEKQYLGLNKMALTRRLALAIFCFIAFYWRENHNKEGELYFFLQIYRKNMTF